MSTFYTSNSTSACTAIWRAWGAVRTPPSGSYVRHTCTIVSSGPLDSNRGPPYVLPRMCYVRMSFLSPAHGDFDSVDS